MIVRKMRLIDVDKLILTLNDYALLNYPTNQDDFSELKPIYDTIQNCIEYVKDQPIIYTVVKGNKK